MSHTNKWFVYFIIILRLLIGGMFIFSGYMKSLNMDYFIQVIYKIKFISFDSATNLAFIIVGMELLLGAMLILGLFLKITLKITLGLLVSFTVFLSSVLIFSLEVKGCGCFGRLSGDQITLLDIVRNLTLIGMVFLLIKKQKYCYFLSIDKKFVKNA